MTGARAVRRALVRARVPILTLAVTYAMSVMAGISLVHSGHRASLAYRDRIVSQAHERDPAARAMREGHRVRAALWDFAGNLGIGATSHTLTGFTVVLPFATATYRGWVGGIVSVTRDRTSRLSDPRRAASYLITLILQLIPYTLAGGIGVQLGLTYFRRPDYYAASRLVWGYPVEAVRDVGRVYLLIPPALLLASLWEFLNPWV